MCADMHDEAVIILEGVNFIVNIICWMSQHPLGPLLIRFSTDTQKLVGEGNEAVADVILFSRSCQPLPLSLRPPS